MLRNLKRGYTRKELGLSIIKVDGCVCVCVCVVTVCICMCVYTRKELGLNIIKVDGCVCVGGGVCGYTHKELGLSIFKEDGGVAARLSAGKASPRGKRTHVSKQERGRFKVVTGAVVLLRSH